MCSYIAKYDNRLLFLHGVVCQAAQECRVDSKHSWCILNINTELLVFRDTHRSVRKIEAACSKWYGYLYKRNQWGVIFFFFCQKENVYDTTHTVTSEKHKEGIRLWFFFSNEPKDLENSEKSWKSNIIFELLFHGFKPQHCTQHGISVWIFQNWIFNSEKMKVFNSQEGDWIFPQTSGKVAVLPYLRTSVWYKAVLCVCVGGGVPEEKNVDKSKR